MSWETFADVIRTWVVPPVAAALVCLFAYAKWVEWRSAGAPHQYRWGQISEFVEAEMISGNRCIIRPSLSIEVEDKATALRTGFYSEEGKHQFFLRFVDEVLRPHILSQRFIIHRPRCTDFGFFAAELDEEGKLSVNLPRELVDELLQPHREHFLRSDGVLLTGLILFPVELLLNRKIVYKPTAYPFRSVLVEDETYVDLEAR